MSDLPTIVSGVGRCGTSMVMAMLEAGGANVLGARPLFEQTIDGHIGSEVVLGEKRPLVINPGYVVKILAPFLDRLDTNRAYRFIWLVRNPMQQAASQAKFAHATAGVETTAEQLREMTKHNAQLAQSGMKHCVTGFGDGTQVYARRFEWCLKQPHGLALDLIEFCELPGNASEMASVIRQRPSECAAGMEFPIERVAS